MAPSHLRSGESRFDTRGNEVQLVKHFISNVPRQSLWAVIDAERRVSIQDFGPKGPRMRRHARVPGGARVPKFSRAEWVALVAEAENLRANAPREAAIIGTADSGPGDDVSEVSEPEDLLGAGAGDLGGDAIPSAPPQGNLRATSGPLSSGTLEWSNQAYGDWAASLLQLRSVLIRAAPAVVLLVGSALWAVPGTAAKLWSVGEKSIQVVGRVAAAGFEGLDRLLSVPEWAWAMFFAALALLYLIHVFYGLRRAWRWLMMEDEEARKGAVRAGRGSDFMGSGWGPQSVIGPEAGDLRGRHGRSRRYEFEGNMPSIEIHPYDDAPRQPKLPPGSFSSDDAWAGYGFGSDCVPAQDSMRASGKEDRDCYGSSGGGNREAAGGPTEITSELVKALQSVSARLENLESGGNSAAQAAAAASVEPEAMSSEELALLRSMRQRTGAFQDVVNADSSGRPAGAAAGGKDKEASNSENPSQTDSMMCELLEAQRRVEKRQSEPTTLLKGRELKEIHMPSMAKERVGPSYLYYIMTEAKSCTSYFENFFRERNLSKDRICSDTIRIASSIDELFFEDGCDVMNSLACERLLRRLLGVETALRDLNGANSLSRADWTVADELDINKLSSGGYQNERVSEEIRRRMERKAQTMKWIEKSRNAEKGNDKNEKKGGKGE